MGDVNYVLLGGRVSTPIEDLGDEEQKIKKRLIQFELAHVRDKRYKPQFWKIWCYGATADIVVDKLKIQVGDKINVEGFAVSQQTDEGRKCKIIAYHVWYLVGSAKHQGKYMLDEGPEIEVGV